jgi:ribosome biogenesis GTPase / thiamine phosphate phosphatase
VSSLERLGWGPFFEAQEVDRARQQIARVVEEQRGQYRVAGEFDGWAEVSGRFRHSTRAHADYPVVGDWVSVSATQGAAFSIIHHRFERRSALLRKAAGRTTDEQVIAANVDTILIVTALTEDFSPRRLERYLAMVWEAGATAVVVLNKADLAPDPESVAAATRARLGLEHVVTLNALSGDGPMTLARYLAPATTLALVGSSGVGKSTIVNRLLGFDRQQVGPIRESDGTGRHTTSSRCLVELPNGALLIDTPGMRELQPAVDEAVLENVFDDIARLSSRCRFVDCSHTQEPECAVLAAVEDGTFDVARLDHYRHLLREAAYEHRKRDKAAASEERRRWKQIALRHRARERERNRD